MAGNGVERLAVVAPDGVVVGVLTSTDVVAWLAACEDAAPSAPSPRSR
jgi:CBS domain-containing protein